MFQKIKNNIHTILLTVLLGINIQILFLYNPILTQK